MPNKKRYGETMVRDEYRKRMTARTAFIALTSAAMVAGCGGDGGDGGDGDAAKPVAQQVHATSDVATASATRKALIIGISGVQYSALQKAIASQQLPNLAQLAIVPALAGGVAGTTTQQATLAAPGWSTVLTGGWANRHGIRSDYAVQAMQADTVFELAKEAGAQSTENVDSWSTLVGLLTPATDAGYLNASVDCANVDSCVVSTAKTAIGAGSASVLFANLTGPQVVASASGLQSDYQNALSVVDGEIAQLKAAIAARQSMSGVNEQWLILVTTDQGLDATGAESGLPLLSNETAFIGSNQALTVGSTTTPIGTVAAVPTLAALQSGATQADVTPTVLSWLGAAPNPATYEIDGTSLIGTIGARSLHATPGNDQASLNLTWSPSPSAPSQVQLYRDGTLIATLSGTANAYSDTQLGKTASGVYTFNYTLVSNGTAVSTLAQINYIPPVALDPTLASGLIHFFSFDSGLADAITPSVSMAQFAAASTTTASFVTDNFNAKALQVASLNTTANASNGMKLVDDVTNKPQFTLGFWFYSNDGQNDSPVVSNKNWYSGLNPGITIAEESNGTLKFNVADGSKRSDQSLNFTKNAWVYVAMTVDTTGTQSATAYVDDPTYGLQTATLSLSGFTMAKVAGSYATLGFNEDALGTYYTRTSGGGVPGTMTFNDMTMWNKVLTSAQIQSLFGSKRSLSTIAP
jgi:hypothetical protein